MPGIHRERCGVFSFYGSTSPSLPVLQDANVGLGLSPLWHIWLVAAWPPSCHPTRNSLIDLVSYLCGIPCNLTSLHALCEAAIVTKATIVTISQHSIIPASNLMPIRSPISFQAGGYELTRTRESYKYLPR